jgi:hypothetical protein
MAFGTIQGIANIFRQKSANKALDKLLSQDVTYNKSPFAAQQLAVAKNMFNGRMAGAPQFQNNIFSSQANTLDAVNRNATDSSQALAIAAGAQGQTSQSLEDLQMREAQNKAMMLQNLNQAYGTNIDEDYKVYGDQVRRFGNLAEIRGQQQQNKTSALNGVFNGLNSDINQAISAFGAFSGMPGIGAGGGQGGGMQAPNTNMSGVASRLNWMGNQGQRWNPATRRFE